MKSLKVFLTMAGILACSAALAAGGDSSSGGGAMVCRDALGNIKSAELLDLWEVQFREDGAEAIRTDEDVETQIEKAIERVQGYMGTKAAQELRDYLRIVRSKTREVKPGIELTPPSDALNDLNQVGCKLEGVVLFNDRKELLFVNPAILNALPKTDQAALWVHEAIYKARRKVLKDTNSIATRDFVGWLFGTKYAPLKVEVDSFLLCEGPVKFAFIKSAGSEKYSYVADVGGTRPALASLESALGSTLDPFVTPFLDLVDRKITEEEFAFAKREAEENGIGASGVKTIKIYSGYYPNGREHVYNMFQIGAAGTSTETGLIMTGDADQQLYAQLAWKPDMSRTLFTYVDDNWDKAKLDTLKRIAAVKPLCKRVPFASGGALPW